ncbi:ketopantoate hydroxymethyltransferase [Trinickia symbiotica]|uniref:3-methyl-2-oxobutanoate hydroxymethyltransferase n=1 Tax=Trinickia symbiotica TaxID=863227 RepID=A0A2N7XA01_9BURK|nr:3-methyl-2-oxobutanoate hydroxymethyltransferase [Trinickia symbiotica]PMS38437.1 3-methyl-2-oxobutanoate hydroxymethyltransferase [Trinickia symbiotica]PPK46449.1 ketopantoate hydroxymethyltransferase [Trinickia symbiotica]
MKYLEEPVRKDVSVLTLRAMRDAGERIAMLACYDASFASMLDRCGVDVLLVGDSLGNVVQGHSTTLLVTIGHAVYHTEAVARGDRTALVVSDLPFATYATPVQAFENAARLMRAGAQMVKLEGGAWLGETVHFLVERGIPVCAHIGLTPQSVHALGGFRLQGRTEPAAMRLIEDALALQDAGAQMIVMEAIPAELAAEVTARLAIPTIGIGAGVHCSGQVLVLHDALGVYPGRTAKFVKNFMDGQTSIEAAIKAYVAEVKAGTFPSAEHSFSA